MIRWRTAREQRSARRAAPPRHPRASPGFVAAAGLIVGFSAALAEGPWLAARGTAQAPALTHAVAQATPVDPEPLPGTPCRVVGGGLAVEAEPGDAAWGPLQNAGSVTVSLTAVEVGWTGDADLVAVMARAGGATRNLAEGAFQSPALVPLDEPLSLGPGEVVELGVRVRSDGGVTPWVPHLLVGYVTEGCRVVLRPVEAPRCPLAAERPSAQAEGRHVDMAFRNAGAVTDTIVALEVDWPAAVNGALRALTLDDAPLVAFDGAVAYAPATIDLARWLGAGIALPPGKRVRLGLEFENPVAAGDYTISAVTAGGCTVAGTTLVAVPDCGVTVDAFKASGDAVRLRLSNPRDIARALTAVEAFWPAGDGTALVELLVDGRSAWQGRTEISPAVLGLAEPLAIDGRSAVELTLRFQGPEGALPGADDGSARLGAFTLVASLDGGCRVVYTSLAAPEACDLSAGALVAVPAERTVAIAVSNGGAAAALERLVIGWNARNGPLTGVAWDGVELLAEPVRWSAAPYTLTLAAEARPVIERNVPSALRLRFADGAAPDGYTVELAFATASGAPCDALWVTVPERTQEACAVSVDPVQVDAAAALATAVIRHAGDGSGDVLRWVELAWPPLQALPDLVEVSVQPLGPVAPIVLWSGRSATSGARIDLGGLATLPAGGSTTLRLRFAAPLGLPGDGDPLLTLVLGFDSGCRARSAVPGDLSRGRVSFDGVLVGPLPSPLTRCCWRVQRLRADDTLETIALQVTDATRIEPPGIAPRAGDPVSVEALAHLDGRLEAERVSVHRASRRMRLMGSIQRVGPPTAGTNRPSHVVILDRIVRIDALTLIQGQLAEGAYALAEGEENPDATLTAATIVTAQTVDVVSYVSGRRGVVQDAVFVGSPDDCVQRLRVDHYTVNVPKDAWSDQGGLCVKPARGDQVEISGRRLLADGQSGGQEVIDATGMRLLTRRADREQSLREVTGRLVGVPAGGLLGTWRIAIEGGGEQAFEVRSLAVIDVRLAPPDPRAGILVHARLQEDTPGTFIAMRVRTDWAE